MKFYSGMTAYRPEIDGLRCVAIVFVLLYHFEFQYFGNHLNGGFIGVDVFFVISGYLITRLIFNELSCTGTFQFGRFFEKRSRRLLPVLLLTIVVCLPFAWGYLLPSNMVEFLQSIISSIFFFSNVFFFFATSSYGAENSLLKPLLHTWSLGVEEQFYIFFPILIFISWRKIPRLISILLIVFFLLSLFLAEVLSVNHQNMGFYLPFTRLFELVLGSIIACYEKPGRKLRYHLTAKLLPYIGVLVLFFSLLYFDKDTAHPGFITLLPCVGTALIIAFANRDCLTTRALSITPMVIMGKLSYSIYVIHFPVLAFCRLQGEPSDQYKLIILFLIMVLSIASHICIERPARSRSLVPPTLFYLSIGFTISLLLIVSLLGILNNGWKGRSWTQSVLQNYSFDIGSLQEQTRKLSEDKYKLGFLEKKNKVLIIGDSFARDDFNALSQNTDYSDNTDFLYLPASVGSLVENPAKLEQMLSSLEFQQSNSIILSNRWSNLIDKHQDSYEKLGGLLAKISNYKQKVILFGPRPEFPKIKTLYLNDYLYREFAKNGGWESSRGKNWDNEVAISVNKYVDLTNGEYFSRRKLRRDINAWLLKLTKEHSALFVDMEKIICDMANSSCFGVLPSMEKGIYDYGHYTLAGAAFFGHRLVQAEFFVSLNQ